MRADLFAYRLCPVSRHTEKKKNPTCLFNRTRDFVDWHGDIMPLGRQIFFFLREPKICSTPVYRGFVCSDFFFSPAGSVFCLVPANRYVGNMKLTIHPHLSVRATDWPLFQLSASNDPLGRQEIWASTQGPQISQRP